MQEPWEYKDNDTRTADNLYTFIIFCEDEVSEEVYFKYFETSNIKVNIINKQRSMMPNVIKAITYCSDNNIFTTNEDIEDFRITKGIEVWCVYDRDYNETESISEKNTEFDVSIETAMAKGINVAWSNDAFELWVLLHFYDIDPVEYAHYDRNYYYNILSDFFKNLSSPNSDLQKAILHSTFSYKQDLKHKNNFRNIVRPALIPKTKVAIDRAKKLFEFQQVKINNYNKKPCTMVYVLIEKLLEIGGKEIIV